MNHWPMVTLCIGTGVLLWDFGGKEWNKGNKGFAVLWRISAALLVFHGFIGAIVNLFAWCGVESKQ